MSLGDRIRAAREAAGLNRDELAARVGVHPRTLGNWERGTTVPRSKLGGLERALAVRLREGPPHQDTVSLTGATDAEMLANLAQRLAERDRKIRELEAKLEEIRQRTSTMPSMPAPTRLVARARDTDSDRSAQ